MIDYPRHRQQIYKENNTNYLLHETQALKKTTTMKYIKKMFDPETSFQILVYTTSLIIFVVGVTIVSNLLPVIGHICILYYQLHCFVILDPPFPMNFILSFILFHIDNLFIHTIKEIVMVFVAINIDT